MEYVSYIDKTRQYYRKDGYTQDYRWATFSDGPFTPLQKPLAESRVTLISTASFVRLSESGEPIDRARIMGTNELEVFPLPSDWPVERLRSTSEDHDRAQSAMEDINAFFPIVRLREFAEEGVLGSVAASFYRLLPNYSQRKVLNVDAPEVLRRCREDAVDVALLTPV